MVALPLNTLSVTQSWTVSTVSVICFQQAGNLNAPEKICPCSERICCVLREKQLEKQRAENYPQRAVIHFVSLLDALAEMEEAGGGWKMLEEAGGGWRTLEEVGRHWRRLFSITTMAVPPPSSPQQLSSSLCSASPAKFQNSFYFIETLSEIIEPGPAKITRTLKCIYFEFFK